MKLHALILCPFLALTLACGGDDVPPGTDAPVDGVGSEAAAPAAAASSGKTYDDSLDRDTCAALDEDLVREAVPVAAGVEMTRHEIAGTCAYAWEGGAANVSQLNVLESADRAARRFDRAYRAMTPEEQEQAAATMRGEVERRRKEGKLTDDQAEAASGMGEGLARMAGRTVYEEIPDLGDQARYDGTVHTRQMGGMGEVTTAASTAYVRSGNLIFAVTVDLFQPDDMDVQLAGPDEAQRRENREATLRLARAILGHLD